MSAISGTFICERIFPSTFASRSRGTATRMISQPASSRRWISSSVATTSSVLVVHIDCTAIGASPPIGTSPTKIWRLLRLSVMSVEHHLDGGRRRDLLQVGARRVLHRDGEVAGLRVALDLALGHAH